MTFDQYDKASPEVWRLFQKFSVEAKAKGFQRYSAKGIFELIRWHTAAQGADGFKLNNNFHPDYARKLMMLNPSFVGFFRIRELKKLRGNVECMGSKPD